MLNNGVLRALAFGLAVVPYSGMLEAQQVPAGETVSEQPGPLVAAPSVKRPAEMAAKAPQISCQSGQLTIRAENSTMRSILAGVQACTGVQIEVPDSAADDRSYIQLGPGSTREVMNTLLGSTDLDYVIQPSKTSPEKIAKILLFARVEDNTRESGSSRSEGKEISAARRSWMASRNAGRPPARPSETEESESAAGEPAAQSAAEESLKQPDAVTAVGAPGSGAKKDSAANEDNTPKSSPSAAPETSAAVDAPPPSAPADPAKNSTGGSELQNKIQDMQQLFEERKKMAANPAAPQTQN